MMDWFKGKVLFWKRIDRAKLKVSLKSYLKVGVFLFVIKYVINVVVYDYLDWRAAWFFWVSRVVNKVVKFGVYHKVGFAKEIKKDKNKFFSSVLSFSISGCFMLFFGYAYNVYFYDYLDWSAWWLYPVSRPFFMVVKYGSYQLSGFAKPITKEEVKR